MCPKDHTDAEIEAMLAAEPLTEMLTIRWREYLKMNRGERYPQVGDFFVGMTASGHVSMVLKVTEKIRDRVVLAGEGGFTCDAHPQYSGKISPGPAATEKVQHIEAMTDALRRVWCPSSDNSDNNDEEAVMITSEDDIRGVLKEVILGAFPDALFCVNCPQADWNRFVVCFPGNKVPYSRHDLWRLADAEVAGVKGTTAGRDGPKGHIGKFCIRVAHDAGVAVVYWEPVNEEVMRHRIAQKIWSKYPDAVMRKSVTMLSLYLSAETPEKLCERVEAHRFENPVTVFSMRLTPSGATLHFSNEPMRDVIRDVVHDAMRRIVPGAQGFQSYQPFENKWVLDLTTDGACTRIRTLNQHRGRPMRRYCVEVLKDLDTVVIRWD